MSEHIVSWNGHQNGLALTSSVSSHSLSAAIRELRPISNELIKQAVNTKLSQTTNQSERALRNQFVALRSRALDLATKIMVQAAPAELAVTGNDRFAPPVVNSKHGGFDAD